MRLALACLTALAYVQSVSALYFYLGAGQNRCFIEEIPKDTIVVGESSGCTSPGRWDGPCAKPGCDGCATAHGSPGRALRDLVADLRFYDHEQGTTRRKSGRTRQKPGP